MINQLPIIPTITDSNEAKALTPADLLDGYQAKYPLPESKRILQCNSTNTRPISLQNKWKFQQSILNTFWKRFRTEYLEHLHAHPPKTSRPLLPGDICLLHDEASSRAFWPICRIISLSGGLKTDLRQRSCLIKTRTGQILRRPIHLLYQLEV